jgi:uncharacterized ion transporter superfamily protein YfcC
LRAAVPGLIILVAVLTGIVPAGLYQRLPSEALGKDVPVAGSYSPKKANPQDIFDVILVPIAGFHDPIKYTANAIALARAIVVVMDAGHISDTILHAAELGVAGLS